MHKGIKSTGAIAPRFVDLRPPARNYAAICISPQFPHSSSAGKFLAATPRATARSICGRHD